MTSNPTIIAKAISGSADYDGQLAALTAAGRDAEASYWSLVTEDLHGALRAPMTCAIPSRPGWRTPPSPHGSSMS